MLDIIQFKIPANLGSQSFRRFTGYNLFKKYQNIKREKYRQVLLSTDK